MNEIYILLKKKNIQNRVLYQILVQTKALVGVAQLAGPIICTPKGCRFDFQSGHMPRLRVQALVGVRTGSNQSMFLSVSPFTLSLKAMKKCPRVRIKKKISKRKKCHLKSKK